MSENSLEPARERPPLSPRQRLVLSFIEGHAAEFGRPPTLREIGKALDITSTNGVTDHLRRLETKGYLERDAIVTRGIRVVPGVEARRTRPTCAVPVNAVSCSVDAVRKETELPVLFGAPES